LIIAFRTQQGLSRGHGRTGATTGLEPAGRRAVDIADRLFQLAFEVAVYFTANLGARFGDGLACERAYSCAGKKEGEPRRQIRTLVTRRSKGA